MSNLPKKFFNVQKPKNFDSGHASLSNEGSSERTERNDISEGKHPIGRTFNNMHMSLNESETQLDDREERNDGMSVKFFPSSVLQNRQK